MTSPQDEALWRNRFIAINMVRIGGTALVLFALLIWNTDMVREGGTIELGLPLALIGLAISFGGPKWLARKWRTPPGGMKRFYREATAAPAGSGFAILLDGRPVKTPGRAMMLLPNSDLAEVIAAEWDAQGEEMDPHAMLLTSLAYAAIDRVAPDPEGFAQGISAYGESDLLCYRSEGPGALVRREAECWNTLLEWARRRFDAEFQTVSGIMHRPQPEHSIRQLARAVAAYDPFALAALSPLVTIAGSVIVALALAEGEIDLETAWAAANVDETWQAEQWGEDALAAATMERAAAEFEAGYRFLNLAAGSG